MPNKVSINRQASNHAERSTPVGYERPRKPKSDFDPNPPKPTSTKSLLNRPSVIKESEKELRPFTAPKVAPDNYTPIPKYESLHISHGNQQGYHQVSVYENSNMASHAPKTHAICVEKYSKAFTEGIGGNAVAIEFRSFAYATEKFGKAITLEPDSTSRSRGDFGHAFAAGNKSTAIADGKIAHAITTGLDALAVNRNEDGSDTEVGVAACFGLNGVACTFHPNGKIILAYIDRFEKTYELAVGYVGKEIEAGFKYQVDDTGRFISLGRYTD